MSDNKTPERVELDELAVEQRNPWLRSLLRKASRYQRHLEAENRRLTADLEEAQATIEDVRHDLSAAQTERDWTEKLRIGSGHLIIGNSSVPRIITAEELKPGQLVAIHRGHSWGIRAIGIFQEISDEKITLKMGNGETFEESINFHTIVLLADAPEPAEPELPTAPGSVILVTEWNDKKLDQPIQATLDESELWAGVKQFPDGPYVTNPCEITGFRPARIVVEDGE